MTVSIFLADDQRLIRDGLRMMIETEDDLRVVGEAGDGLATVSAVAQSQVDVVLMDVRMPIMNGVEATLRLTQLKHPARVLILTTFDLDEYVFAALRAGAAGFLLKDAQHAELLSALRGVADGGSVIAPSATRRLLTHFAHRLPDPGARPDHRLRHVTAREIEVLQAIAAGATNAEIAQRLHMAEGTVKTHIGNLLAKLHCRDRVALVLLAFETGLAGPDRP
jgi:DNA-binding NarL/FixJ family response regulator